MTALGGPAAHIAMMHGEIVRKRAWLDEQEFLDLVGATNLIPGPNSTEMAIAIGYRRAKWPGLVVAGLAFIVPAMLIVLALAWAYVRYGTTPAAEGLLYGVEPVVIAIIAVALINLVPAATKRSPLLVAVGVFATVLYLLDVYELALMAGGGAIVWAARGSTRRGAGHAALLPLLAWPSFVTAVANASLDRLFLVFLKIGALVYGSGYVLFAFLHGDLVERLGWLTEQQLVDALAVGQMTPGPVFTTATFIGYVVQGAPGALLATLGIFLPSFVLVALLRPVIRLVQRKPWARDVLDGVNVAAIGLMVGVMLHLGARAIIDVPTIAIGLAALAVLLLTRIAQAWVVVGGAAIGIAMWF